MPEVLDSILLTVKKLNNVVPEYTAFDNDFITYINSALADLNQLGIGPTQGFAIEGEDESWDDLLGSDPRLNAVITYVGLKVRLLFDPPNTSFAISMMEKQLDEHAWRLTAMQQDLEEEARNA